MKKNSIVVFLSLVSLSAFSQTDLGITNPALEKKQKEEIAAKTKADIVSKLAAANISTLKELPVSVVKNQGNTGTCWCFSTTSLIESQCVKNNLGDFDLSEMFSVRNTYVEKAKNYILRQGKAQFSEGGLGHDLINAIAKYGAVPEKIYSGAKPLPIPSSKFVKPVKDTVIVATTGTDPIETVNHNHEKLIVTLKTYLDDVLSKKPINANWQMGYDSVLDAELGKVPEKFIYAGKEYTPKTFASTILKFNASDYISITSFTHHPYYSSFILEVPDNFSNGQFYNLPLNEMIQLTKEAINKGYSVMWDADVSNEGFMQDLGYAFDYSSIPEKERSKSDIIKGVVKEGKYTAEKRQKLFENLTTQDDHLMHIVGLKKGNDGKEFFAVKNSWGEKGPFKGFINVTENYFAINTVSLIVPKAALSKALLEKLNIK
jgi:bleomycin hydrolase